MIPAVTPRPEDWRTCELIAFDLRMPGTTKRLVSESAAWRGSAHIELLDPHHAVLVVRAGGAREAERKVA